MNLGLPETTGMVVICEYTLRPFDICDFFAASIFVAVSVAILEGSDFFIDIFLT